MLNIEHKFKAYYLTAVFSLIFAVTGFSYNAWRMEVTEDNSNVRTASFETLLVLAELQQLIYSAHYDQDMVAGNPRTGWVKIGLISDLSILISQPVMHAATELHQSWTDHWNKIQNNKESVELLINDIDSVRATIKQALINLK